jgi:hypothetical protein
MNWLIQSCSKEEGRRSSDMEGIPFYYQFLSPVDKLVYNEIVKGIQNRAEQIRIVGTSAQAKRIMPMVFLDHPQFFYIDTTRYSVTSGMGFTVLQVSYHKNLFQTKKMQQKLKLLGERFLDEIKKRKMNNFMTVKYVHDFLIRNTEYAKENLQSQQVDGDVSSIVGVFFRHRAVCLGIAQAAKWLLDLAGIPSGIIEGNMPGHAGEVMSGEEIPLNHAWNLVNVNDIWQYMDVTMDLGASTTKQWIAYDYFLRKESEMKKYLQFVPPEIICDREPNSYFVGNHASLTNGRQIKDYILMCTQKGRKRICFQLVQDAEHIPKDRILQCISDSVIGAGGYQYRCNDKLHIYDILLV